MPVAVPCLDCGALLTRPGRPGARLCEPCRKRREYQRNHNRAHYRGGWSKLSRELRAAAQRCQECGGPGPLEVDHVSPRSTAGGLRVLCRPCHRRKTRAG